MEQPNPNVIEPVSPDLPVNTRLQLLEELLACGDPLCFWYYTQDYRLTRTNSRQLVLQTIFEHTGCLEYMKQFYRGSRAPLVLSSYLGLMWCAAHIYPEKAAPGTHTCVVIGPVVTAEISPDTLQNAARHFEVDLSWRKGFIETMRSIPVVTPSTFFQYALMLHCCLNGERLRRSGIAFQQNDLVLSDGMLSAPARPKNRRANVYRQEQELLSHIRTGNLDYTRSLERAHQQSPGVRVTTGDPLQQAVISAVTFTSLCVRAAIEGGLSPDIAYSLGDSYIQRLSSCTSITATRSINHEMYDDFVRRVHALRQNPAYSPQVRSCIEHIEMHLEDDITLQQLAQRIGYAEYYLSRKFKEETGSTVSAWIRGARLKRAAILLETSDLPVARIAEQLHFCSSSYFSARFREHFHMLPQEYRNEKRRL